MAKESKYFCDYNDILKAYDSIKDDIDCTPLVTNSYLDDISKLKLFFKAENLQKTGSFKIRGALNAANNSNKDSKCLVCRSSGNFGLGLAFAGKILDKSVVVVIPSTVPEYKKKALASYGAQTVECKPIYSELLALSRRILDQREGDEISCLRKPSVISGQGTIAIEILQQNPSVEVIVVPVASGALISGVAMAAKSIKPSTIVYGVEPELANSCYLSLKNNELTTLDQYSKTIADGLRGSICSTTWPMIRDYVDDVILVSDEEIKAATCLVYKHMNMLIEPSAGAAVAAVLSKKLKEAVGWIASIKNIAVILTGGNVDIQTLASFYKD